MRQYETMEWSYAAPAPAGSHVGVDLQARFDWEGGHRTVKGFYAGNDTYKFRFLPEQAGEYRCTVTGVVRDSGTFTVEPAQGSHGPVRAEGAHFRYADGTRYLPVGTTVYALAHQPQKLIDQTIDTLARSPFNKLRTCVFPKDYLYNKNEPPLYPFEKDPSGRWNVHRPCFAFWDHLEAQLLRLQRLGIQTDLILFHPYDRWGFAELSQEDNMVYLDYLLRRLAAFPGLWWSLANEYDLCGAKTLSDWFGLEEFIAANDPYGHLLSCHNCFQFWDFHRPAVTHASVQVKTLARLAEWKAAYPKPFMVDECCYEGDLPTQWGCLSGKEMTARFWRAYISGAYCTHGETFLDEDNEVIWWAKGGTLRGESPARIAFLRSVFEELGPVEPAVDPYFTLLLREKEPSAGEMEQVPSDFQPLVRAMFRLPLEERRRYAEYEWLYRGHVGEAAYLTYYDTRCYTADVLHLPTDKTYRVEVIDTWEMTKTVIRTGARGETVIHLPGKEGIAVLAVAE